MSFIFFIFLTFGDIKIEEVTVEDCLDYARHDGDHVKEALEIETPNPVEEIKGPVHAQAEQVVGGDGLGLASLADHEELREDRHRLQVDGEGPQDLMENLQVNTQTKWLLLNYQSYLTFVTT